MKAITLNEYWSLSQQERDNFTGTIECDGNTIEYHKNGKYHREDGPAKTYSDGSEFWYFKGKRHRIGGPAVIYKEHKENKKVIKEYWIHGQQCTKKAHDLWVDLMILKELKSKI